jgi:hypothetical protein
MDDFGNQLFDVEYLFSGYDYSPFGIVAWCDQATDMDDEEFFNV